MISRWDQYYFLLYMYLLCEEMYLTQIFGTQGYGVLWPLLIKNKSSFSYFALLSCPLNY